MGWDTGSLGPPVSRVEIELYTTAFRVSGHLSTRFQRVADILNVGGTSHIILEQATVAEFADPTAARGGQSVMVAVDSILFGISAADTGVDPGASGDEMSVHKRPVKIQLALPPFWVTGTIQVPHGSQATDVLNVAERFLPLSQAAVSSAAHPGFDGTAPAVAVQRNLAEILLVTDDTGPDATATLADLIPEEEANRWLHPELEA
jgi:hypothetical protein